MAKKFQTYQAGGLRKVIQPAATVAAGTTIAGLEGTTITLAQLVALIGAATAVPNTQTSSPSAALILGPGLSGGGALVGAVPLRLNAPSPVFIFSDDGEEGSIGPPGINGVIGINGAPGAATYLAAEDGEDGWHAIPGNPGSVGTAGAQGGPGVAVMFFADDGEEVQGWPGPAGAAGAAGATGGGNITPDTHGTLPTGVGLGPNDEFEAGSSIDTGGTRYTGATGWTAFNLGTGSTAVSEGSLVFTPQVGTPVNYSGYVQPVAAGSWTYTAKLSESGVTASNLGGILLATSAGASGHLYLFGPSGSPNITAQRATNSSTFSTNPATGAYIGQVGQTLNWAYIQISFNGTTLVFSVSASGVPGSFVTVLSETATTFLGTPALIGIGAENQGSGNLNIIVDWFRRTA